MWESKEGSKAFIQKRKRADRVLLWKSLNMVLGWFPGKGMVGRWNSVYTRTYIGERMFLRKISCMVFGSTAVVGEQAITWRVSSVFAVREIRFGRVWETKAGGKAFLRKRHRADGVLL